MLSGRRPKVIAEQADRLRRHWEANPRLSLEDITRSAALTLTQFEERAAIVASDRAAALDALTQLAEGVLPFNTVRGTARSRAEVAVCFSGIDSRLTETCRVMYQTFAVFRDSFDATARVLDLELSRPLTQAVLEPDSAALLQKQTYAQPALFAFQVALFRLCEAWGLSVGAVIGLSAGELAAAHLSGVLSLEDACRRIAARGRSAQSQDESPDEVQRESARFTEAVRKLESDGFSLFLELGPACLSERPRSEALWVSALNNASSPQDALTWALSALHVQGARINWTAFFKHIGGRRVELPTYPFRARRHWIASTEPVDPAWTYRREWVRLDRPVQEAVLSRRVLFLGAHGPHRRGLEAVLGAGATFACSLSGSDAVAALASNELQAVVFFANGNWDAVEGIATLTAVKGSQARVFWVTQECWPVGDANATGPVDQAALWGIGLSCSVEYGDRWGGLIDIPCGPLKHSTAQRLLEVICGTENERQLAIRNDATYVARLARLPIAQDARRPALRTDVAYLVTGGFGGLGLRVAKWLADRGARHLVLIGRTGLPERRCWKDLVPSSHQAKAAQALRELELRGVNVQTAAFDVADGPAWSEWMSQ